MLFLALKKSTQKNHPPAGGDGGSCYFSFSSERKVIKRNAAKGA